MVAVQPSLATEYQKIVAAGAVVRGLPPEGHDGVRFKIVKYNLRVNLLSILQEYKLSSPHYQGVFSRFEFKKTNNALAIRKGVGICRLMFSCPKSSAVAAIPKRRQNRPVPTVGQIKQ